MKKVNKSVNKAVYTYVGTHKGKLSSKEPNIQAVPKRTKYQELPADGAKPALKRVSKKLKLRNGLGAQDRSNYKAKGGTVTMSVGAATTLTLPLFSIGDSVTLADLKFSSRHLNPGVRYKVTSYVKKGKFVTLEGVKGVYPQELFELVPKFKHGDKVILAVKGMPATQKPLTVLETDKHGNVITQEKPAFAFAHEMLKLAPKFKPAVTLRQGDKVVVDYLPLELRGSLSLGEKYTVSMYQDGWVLLQEWKGKSGIFSQPTWFPSECFEVIPNQNQRPSLDKFRPGDTAVFLNPKPSLNEVARSLEDRKLLQKGVVYHISSAGSDWVMVKGILSCAFPNSWFRLHRRGELEPNDNTAVLPSAWAKRHTPPLWDCPKWEYEILNRQVWTPESDAQLKSDLAFMGSNGWQLCATITTVGGTTLYHFKRQLK